MLLTELNLDLKKIPKLHMSSILANMLMSQCTERPIAHATKNEYIWEKMYNPFRLSRQGITKMLKSMKKKGYINQFPGFKYGRFGKPSTFEPTQKLLNILGGFSDLSKLVFTPTQVTLIKKVKGVKKGYADNANTKWMKVFLNDYNDMLSSHEVLHPTDTLFMVSQVIMKRNFINFTKKLGGRFYGPWQNISSKVRGNLTIDGHRTVELDFKAMNIAMLWGKEGSDMFEHFTDSYTIETNIHPDKKVQRRVVKKLFMSMFGTTCPRDAINATKDGFRKSYFLDYYVLMDAVIEIRKKQQIIDHHFFKGESFMLRLQFMDSQVCETVLETMMAQNILALPIHDSFIVQEDCEEQLREAMELAFMKHCGGFKPVIEKK